MTDVECDESAELMSKLTTIATSVSGGRGNQARVRSLPRHYARMRLRKVKSRGWMLGRQ